MLPFIRGLCRVLAGWTIVILVAAKPPAWAHCPLGAALALGMFFGWYELED